MLILLFSFSLFPITIVYLSPAPPIMGLKAGVINLSVLTIFSVFISGFIFRRAFCGWVCPGNGCQLVAQALNNKRKENQKTNWFRIVLISVWVLIMIATVIFAKQLPKFDLGNPGAGKFATSNIRYFLPYIPVTIFIFLFVYLFGRQGFCRRGCWIYPLIAFSTKLGTITHIPSLYVAVKNSDKCNDCKLCTQICPMSIDIYKHIRTNVKLPNDCIQCGLCIDKCTKDVLSFSFGIEK
jgi:polyferredoxin